LIEFPQNNFTPDFVSPWWRPGQTWAYKILSIILHDFVSLIYALEEKRFSFFHSCCLSIDLSFLSIL